MINLFENTQVDSSTIFFSKKTENFKTVAKCSKNHIYDNTNLFKNRASSEFMLESSNS